MSVSGDIDAGRYLADTDQLVEAPPMATPGLLDGYPWAYQTRRFRGLGYDFTIRTTDGAAGPVLDAAFSSLAAGDDGTATPTVYSVLHRARARYPYALYVDDERATLADRPSYILGYLTWHVNRQVVARRGDNVLVHAAAAALDGIGVVLPAAMEAGKTTLVAGLVHAGFDYLTDEAVAVDPQSGLLHPYPKPLSVDPGSWEVLAHLDPRFDTATHAYFAEQWQVPPEAIRAEAVSGPTEGSLIVFPRYVEGARTALVPMTRAEALRVMLEQTFHFHANGRRNLETLGRLAAACSCYRLSVGDLESACMLLKDAVLRERKGQLCHATR